MSILINIEMPTRCAECRLSTVHSFNDRPLCDVLVEYMSYGEWEAKRLDNCPLVHVPEHGRLIDADKIGLTDFEIILCQKGNPFKNALEMLLEKIENAPTIIPADGKDTDVHTREEEK